MNRDSFILGLRVGMQLRLVETPFEPPEFISNWTASEEWLLYDAGVWAYNAQSSRSPVTKTNNGKCIALVVEDCNDGQFGGDWCSCVLISTVRDAVMQSLPGNTPMISTKTYLGMTWYISRSSQNALWGGATTYTTSCVKLNYGGEKLFADPNSSEAITDSSFLSIMQSAHVRLA